MAETAETAALSLGDFEPHLGQVFPLRLAEDALALCLTEAEGGRQGTRAGGAFSLVFTGPPGDYLPQGVYPLDHPTLGRLELFLVPLGPDERGHRYQAVFA